MLNLQKNFPRISVFGLGYIGLPTAAVLASKKLHVIGVDIKQEAIDTINRGEIHFIEPELDIVVHSAVTEGYLRATLHPEPADIFIIAVPTPFQANHQPDLNYVLNAAQAIAKLLKKGDLVILESTSPVGTTAQIGKLFAEERPDLIFPVGNEPADVNIAYCPERVLPGKILHEIIKNDRVIGGLSSQCSVKAVEFYQLFIEGECVVTNAQTAEMCKLTENSFRDVNIAFANELSMICDKLSINVWELIQLANRHPRVSILQPGPGVGGHCIAVDPWFIVSKTPEDARLIAMAREVNDSKPTWVVNKVKLALAQFLQKHPTKTAKEVSIAFLGITFKADIDDLRESPALNIVKQWSISHPGPILIVEPNISCLPPEIASFGDLKTIETAFAEADIIVVLVDHKPFKALQKPVNNAQLIIDIRGLWKA